MSFIKNSIITNKPSVSNSKSIHSKIKPRYFRLLGEVLNNHSDQILNYLDLKDLAITRSVNQFVLALVHQYYPKRLKLEVERIHIFQEENFQLILNFMELLDSQIPYSTNNWLDFDFESVNEKLKILDKNILTSIKAIKHLVKIPEEVFAPFCHILGYNVRIVNNKILFYYYDRKSIL